MKKILFILLFFGYTILASAQNTPKVGDLFVINKPYGQNYTHVKFPRLNILTKRGKVANYKSVYGNRVTVDDVITKADGSIYVMLKKKDGTKFFGYLNTVKAHYAKALEAKEILLLK
mgnify:CR=1 FL=1